MDIEQLKLILQTLEAAGEGAKDVAMMYFATLLVPKIMSGVLWATFGVFTVLTVKRVLTAIITSCAVARQIANELGVTVLGEWIASDTRRVLEEIQRLKRKPVC